MPGPGAQGLFGPSSRPFVIFPIEGSAVEDAVFFFAPFLPGNELDLDNLIFGERDAFFEMEVALGHGPESDVSLVIIDSGGGLDFFSIEIHVGVFHQSVDNDDHFVRFFFFYD